MLIKAKILKGTHTHDGKKYGVGEVAFVPEKLIKHIPKKFQVVDKEEVVEKKDEPILSVEPEQKDEPEIPEFPETEKTISEQITELINDGEPLNADGFPTIFEPKKSYPEFEELSDDTVFPYNYGGQWFYLSNGCKVMGSAEAERGQKLIQLIYGQKDAN